jgi:hypothetical protein
MTSSIAFAAPPPMLKGPAPRSTLYGEEPTLETIKRDLAGWYADPSLVVVTATHEDATLTRWSKSYDGIEMEFGAATSKQGHQWVTHFTAELSGPERPKRDKLIKESAALKAANMPNATAKLYYHAVLSMRQLAGTTGDNAMNFIQVIESWQLVYKVETHFGGTYIDAYTGKRLKTWSVVEID